MRSKNERLQINLITYLFFSISEYFRRFLNEKNVNTNNIYAINPIPDSGKTEPISENSSIEKK